ncbi:MAG: hypothetical protein LLG04_17200 [Parachlamydia sp.]|nr:hypothetical protein [Parachlamydia sp.]
MSLSLLSTLSLKPSARQQVLPQKEYTEWCTRVVSATFDRGHPPFALPMSNLEMFADAVLEHLHNPEKQKSLYENENRTSMYISSSSFDHEPVKLSDAVIDVTLRYLVLAGRIAAYVRGTVDKRHLGMANLGFWAYETKEEAKPVQMFPLYTRDKILETSRKMTSFKQMLDRLPPQNNTDTFKRILESLKAAYCNKVTQNVKESLPLDPTVHPDDPVTIPAMDFLVENKVIAAWNVNRERNTVYVQFNPTDELAPRHYLWSSWRGTR